MIGVNVPRVLLVSLHLLLSTFYFWSPFLNISGTIQESKMAPSAVTVYPAAAPPSKLLDANSPELELVLATPEESIQCALLNYKSWSGPLAQEAYLRRERHLASQEAALNGAHSGWILVDKSDTKHPRTILAACESIKKRAFVARRGGERAVEEVVVFAIGSVFCREEYRGRGYAVRMMAELQERLETWQQKAGQKTTFTVLFSDIGKVWTPLVVEILEIHG